MKSHALAILTLLALWLVPFANAVGAPIVIDDFSVGPITLMGIEGQLSHSQTGLDPAHVIGGQRDFVISGLPPRPVVEIEKTAGELRVNGGMNGIISIHYGLEGPDLDLNLLGPGKAVMLDILGRSDVARFTGPNVHFHSAGGHATASGLIIPGVTEKPLAGGSRVLIPVSSMFIQGMPDLSSIRRVEINYNDPGLGVRLSQVAIVPEPAGLALSLAGLFGFLRCERRRD